MDFRDVAILRATHKRDIETALLWWKEASEGDRAYVWISIQEMGDSSLTEIISRFAQIGMTEIALRNFDGIQRGE